MILIIGGPGSGEKKVVVNVISHQRDIDKIYLYAKNQNEAKHNLFINKRKGVGLKHYNHSKAFIEYSNDIDDIFENIEENNLNKERKTLIVFDVMIDGMVSNENSTSSNRITY